VIHPGASSAANQVPAGITSCGRSPLARSSPSRATRPVASGASSRASSGPPSYR
jgi:hypothetical protein